MAKNREAARRCMPLDEWPAADQLAWHTARQSGGLLDDNGLAAHWRHDTCRSIISAYGRFLTFLERKGWLDRSVGPAPRLTSERLWSYVEEIQGQVASVTLRGRIVNLSEALRVMVPGEEYPYLLRAKLRLKQRARPIRNKRARMVPARQLLELGVSLMQRAEKGEFPSGASRAGAYRDGLIIAILICRPVRLKNMASITLGRHLVRHGDRYMLQFEADETKGRHPYASSFHPKITPFIDRYLQHYRPTLLKSAKTERLWIAMGGNEMAERSINGVVVSRTKAAFGTSLSPHLFRDCAVTSLGHESPENVWASMSLLGHSDPRTAEQHYDQALSDEAVRDYQSTIQRQRLTAKRKAEGASL